MILQDFKVNFALYNSKELGHIKYYGVQLIYYVPEVRLQWDRHARDLFQSPPVFISLHIRYVRYCLD